MIVMKLFQTRISLLGNAALLFSLLLSASPAIASRPWEAMDSDCHALKLKSATGLPQESVHTYEFVGTCNINALDGDGAHVLRTVPASASATWDANKLQLTESFHLLADVNISSTKWNVFINITPGNVESTFKCSEDPIVTQNTACLTTFHSNNSAFPPFSNPAQKQNRPLLRGKTTLAEATKLSKLSGPGSFSPKVISPLSSQPLTTDDKSTAVTASQGPQVPQPRIAQRGALEPSAPAATRDVNGSTSLQQRKLSQPESDLTARAATSGQTSPSQRRLSPPQAGATATILNVEGEDLAKSDKFQVAGGQVTAQPMAGFGAGWSGEGQLFWSGGSVGAVLDLLVDIPAAATYALELYPTRAPDYGQIKIQIDGKDVIDGKGEPVTLDAYSPRVMQPSPRQIGKFSLAQGEHKISFMIVGKNPMATDYLVGIDRIRLYPVLAAEIPTVQKPSFQSSANTNEKENYLQRVLNSQQREELASMGRVLARNPSYGTIHSKWTEFVSQMDGDEPIDINALVQFVLKESFLQANEDLKLYADKVKSFNELKKNQRMELKKARLQRAQSSNVAQPAPLQSNTDDPHGDSPPLTLQSALPHTTSAVTPTDAEIQRLEAQLAATGNDEQLANLHLQNAMQRLQQNLQTLTNVAKQMYDAAMSIIRKIGG